MSTRSERDSPRSARRVLAAAVVLLAVTLPAVAKNGDCVACHGDTSAAHAFHATLFGPNGESMVECAACHGNHDMPRVDDEASRLAPAQLVETCGACHEEVADHFARSEHGRALQEEVTAAPSCIDCHRNPITPARGNGDVAARKLAQERICLDCHLDDSAVRARMGPDSGFIAAFEASVHGAALVAGNGDAATCVDCHGSHEMRHGTDPEARVSKMHIPETCASCHQDIATEYASSVHAIALQRGSIDAPVCTDCHGEHDIRLHDDPRSPVAFSNLSEQVCTPCHSSVKLSLKYGLAANRRETFDDSYHGLALRGGSVEAANCASCHGAHNIRRSSDPTSKTHKANLATTCGRCHPGANERFAIGAVHIMRDSEDEPVLHWIASIYVVVIVTTVGGMLVHNALDLARRASRRRKIRQGLVEEPQVGHTLYLRMSLGERWQHAMMMVSFFALVVTGFMLSYPDAWWVAAIRRVSSGAFEMRTLVHRIAAVVMVGAAVYHVFYIVLTLRGRHLIRDLLPRLQDVRDAAAMLKYNLRLSHRRPAFGRFGYAEKVEYWALAWGTALMAATGSAMWFENTFIGIFTKLGWDIARTIHYFEAWLAMLAVLIWHFYFVLFNPDVYPMNMAWLTGQISEAEMAEEHPRELAERRAQAARRRRSDD